MLTEGPTFPEAKEVPFTESRSAFPGVCGLCGHTGLSEPSGNTQSLARVHARDIQVTRFVR